jgi:hypothetical protein
VYRYWDFSNIFVGSKKIHLPLNGLDPKHFELNLKNLGCFNFKPFKNGSKICS